MDKAKTCRDCPDRAVGCHGNCEPYLERVKKQRELNEKIRVEKERMRGIAHTLYHPCPQKRKRNKK